MLKKIMTRLRTSVKLISLVGIASVIIVGAVSLVYKPIYSVTLDGKFIGYTENKKALQKKIGEYIKSESDENIAFVDITELPEYHLCLLKKNIVSNDDEIFDTVTTSGITCYKYYAILENKEEKLYVASADDAEKIVEGLKEKSSYNIDNITYIEKHELELKDYTEIEEAVSSLYVAPPVVKTTKKSYSSSSSGSVSYYTISHDNRDLGISLIRPISGSISSRFATRSSVRTGIHTGLDIAAPRGTAIKAAASGTVTFAGYKGNLGNLVKISHGNGIETYYGHCSAIYVSAGDTVNQGDTIAAVGSTGNSTGNHLHLEVRVNGVAYNPQHYVY